MSLVSGGTSPSHQPSNFRFTWGLLGFFLLACHDQPTPVSPARGVAASTDVLAKKAPQGAQIRKIEPIAPAFTGAQRPRITLINRFLVVQYVFIDEQAVAVVKPDEEASFDVTEGPHLVLTSDSQDGKRNPLHIAEVYDAGFQYRYEVVAR
jgi:hypothetical protein